MVIHPASADQIQLAESESQRISSRVSALLIRGENGLSDAAILLHDINIVATAIDMDLGPPKKKAHEIHRDLSALYKKHIDPLKALERTVKGKVGAYRIEEQRIARVAAAEVAKQVREEAEAAQLAEAELLEDAGEHDAADEVINEEPPPPPPPPAAVKVEGMSSGWTFSATVNDVARLARAAADGDPLALSILEDSRVIAAADAAASRIARNVKERFSVAGCKLHKVPKVTRR